MIFCLRRRPHVLDGVEFGSICGKSVDGEPVLVGRDPVLDDLRPMRGQTVHEQYQVSASLMSFEFFEKTYDVRSPYAFLLHREHEPRTCAVRAAQKRAGDRSVLPSSCGFDIWSFSSLRPRVAHYRSIGEPRFVMKTKGRSGCEPLFLIVDHVSLCQRRMADSFLSFARRTGFWLVHPMERSIFHTWPG